jgi:hypothetical protein
MGFIHTPHIAVRRLYVRHGRLSLKFAGQIEFAAKLIRETQYFTQDNK